jgi:signal transduction histidine kinase
MSGISPTLIDDGALGARLRAFLKRFGLRASVVLVFLISGAMLWAGLFAHLNIERERIIESKRQENDNLARVFEEHVARTVRAAEITLREITSEYRRHGRKFDLIRFAKDHRLEVDPYNFLSFIDKDGNLISASYLLPEPMNYRQYDSFQYQSRARPDTPQPYLSAPRIGTYSRKLTMFLSIPLNNADESFDGLALVGMDPAYFSKIYAELDLGKDATVILLRRDGVILARASNSDTETGVGQNMADTPLFTRLLPAANRGSFTGTSTLDGIVRIISYRAIKDYPLVVVVGTSRAVALADHVSHRSIYMQAAGAMTAVILCLGLFVLFQIARSGRAEETVGKLNAELEQRVRERTAKLEAANKELEAFSYSVAHDLRAPLRGLDGYSRLLQTDYADKLDDEGRGFLHNIVQAAKQMSELIDDLLAYSHLEQRDMQLAKVDPRALIESLLADRADDIRSRGVTVSVAVACPSMTADREGLAIALRNLLGNALKFTRDVPKPMIEIGGRDEGSARLLWVRDNGVRFDMKFHDRIFAIFQRLHRSEDYPGTGVGLAIVKKAMERMGGRAWAESAPGKGATFYLEIPE